MTTISLSISHTPWRPERVESLERLVADLRRPDPNGHVQLMTDRVPCHTWSERMWRHAVQIGADWSLFLQDDARVAPDFRAQLEAMIDALGPSADVIGLEAVHPAIPMLADAGYRWCTTRDGLVGVGYAVRTSALREFLDWRATMLKPGWQDRLTDAGTGEDTLLGLWCLVSGTRVWHPIPTPLDHDVSLGSTYANDGHRNRRPLVRWDTFKALADGGTTTAANWETSNSNVANLGIFPMWQLPVLARREVVYYTDEKMLADLADNGGWVLANVLAGSKVRCFFCCESRGPSCIVSGLTHIGLCRSCVAQAAVKAMLP